MMMEDGGWTRTTPTFYRTSDSRLPCFSTTTCCISRERAAGSINQSSSGRYRRLDSSEGVSRKTDSNECHCRRRILELRRWGIGWGVTSVTLGQRSIEIKESRGCEANRSWCVPVRVLGDLIPSVHGMSKNSMSRVSRVESSVLSTVEPPTLVPRTTSRSFTSV
jgi:hypothetical protein